MVTSATVNGCLSTSRLNTVRRQKSEFDTSTHIRRAKPPQYSGQAGLSSPIVTLSSEIATRPANCLGRLRTASSAPEKRTSSALLAGVPSGADPKNQGRVASKRCHAIGVDGLVTASGARQDDAGMSHQEEQGNM